MSNNPIVQYVLAASARANARAADHVVSTYVPGSRQAYAATELESTTAGGTGDLDSISDANESDQSEPDVTPLSFVFNQNMEEQYPGDPKYSWFWEDVKPEIAGGPYHQRPDNNSLVTCMLKHISNGNVIPCFV